LALSYPTTLSTPIKCVSKNRTDAETGVPRQIRTVTERVLSPLPLPLGYRNIKREKREEELVRKERNNNKMNKPLSQLSINSITLF
jgi:hypothetical protein